MLSTQRPLPCMLIVTPLCSSMPVNSVRVNWQPPAFAGAGLYGAFDVKRFFPPLSVAAVAAWRIDRLQLLEIELSDGLKLVSQSRSFEVIRQVVEPSAVFVLQIDQRRHGCRPPPWPWRDAAPRPG